MGIGMAVYRRFFLKTPRFFTNAMDRYAVIMISGVFLETAKIGSLERYSQMVTDYADFDGEAEAKALEALWVTSFGVVSPNSKPPFEK